jgi:hypothetical protein
MPLNEVILSFQPRHQSVSHPGVAKCPKTAGVPPLPPRGDPSPKLAITVGSQVHAKVLAAAADEGISVSAWMTTAARRALLIRDGLRAVREWEKENGELTEAELVAARRRVAAEVLSNARWRSACASSTTLE